MDKRASLLQIDDITRKEKEFDTQLIQALHEVNLTTGCYTAKDAEQLLFHYRNLSSLLTPASKMITLTYNEQYKLAIKEINHPVTEKTATQLNALDALSKINPYPMKGHKNAHNIRNLATQEADALFLDLMKQDDYSLPAQARKTHLVGTKNAFIVETQVFFNVESADKQLESPNATLWLARTGSPVYVGKGEKDDDIQTHTIENLHQIRETAKKLMGVKALDLHLMSLNTDTVLENQDRIIRHERKATENSSDAMTLIPTNVQGTFSSIVSSSSLKIGSSSWPLQKKDRVKEGVEIVLSEVSEVEKSATKKSAPQRKKAAVKKK
jgi:hypothetical protein